MGFFFIVVKYVKKDERKYYEELFKYSRDYFMLYFYYLFDIMVKGLRIILFLYYVGIMEVSVQWERIINYSFGVIVDVVYLVNV